ncbi:MAG: M48 family metalloprotease [Amaricoccus sp.]
MPSPKLALMLAAVLLAATPVGVAPAAARQDALVEANGGLYRDPALQDYVRSVGLRLVAAAGRSGRGWSFQVLDTPDANAYARPGPQILVTRGMLALANDEAELATILGHEIGHALAGDAVEARTDAQRRAAEFAADRAGMQLLARAGYDPAAQVDFLRTDLAVRLLEGGADGGANHPALTERLRRARADAAAMAAPGGRRDRARFLAAIDGLAWGGDPARGFLDGRSFVHPSRRFAFETPAGYAVANQPGALIANGPDGAVLTLDSLPDPGGPPERYLIHGWVPEIARGVEAGPLEALRGISLNGMPAAQGQLPLASPGSSRIADLTVVRHDGRLYRLSGLHVPGDRAGAAALAAAAASFRPLSSREAARYRTLRIRIHRIARGEDVAAIAAGMPVDPSRPWFDVLNGLAPGENLRVGDLIKVVTAG